MWFPVKHCFGENCIFGSRARSGATIKLKRNAIQGWGLRLRQPVNEDISQFFYEDIARSEVAKAQIFDVCVVVDAVAEIKMLKSKHHVLPSKLQNGSSWILIISPGPLSSKSGFLDSPERRLRRRDHPLVDSDHPRLQSLPHLWQQEINFFPLWTFLHLFNGAFIVNWAKWRRLWFESFVFLPSNSYSR